ncbi:fibronectin type III-like domain-contianing protein [Streptomyces sp. NPDC049541]|uniref:fibronectin type III-like domain-contianing protein n=1 Tax=Streptomyces sp. NPDC049541 TaxID=3365594 RepID=UPI0037A0D71E
MPGEAGGRAVAEVLFGDVEPTGRLPVTFPRAVGRLPVSYDQKRARADADDHIDLPSTPLFPFGAGLGHTTFRHGRIRLTDDTIKADATTRVRVDLTNTGQRAGTEVVQLYVTDEQTSVSLPYIRLRGVRKVRVEPGKRATVTFDLVPSRDLTLVDGDMRTVVEPGTFEIRVERSSTDVRRRAVLRVI